MKKIIFTLMMLLAGAAPASAHDCSMKKFSITEDKIAAVQKIWGDGIVAIGKADNPKQAAEKQIDTLYAYGLGPVFFKPTRAAEMPFRDTKEQALSYFVGGSVKEDTGFALTPFEKVRFENHAIHIDCDYAVAQGHYYFTPPNKNEIKVEYTLGYIADDQGNLKISLQHSSLPFTPN